MKMEALVLSPVLHFNTRPSTPSSRKRKTTPLCEEESPKEIVVIPSPTPQAPLRNTSTVRLPQYPNPLRWPPGK